jgi:hypothetical protein
MTSAVQNRREETSRYKRGSVDVQLPILRNVALGVLSGSGTRDREIGCAAFWALEAEVLVTYKVLDIEKGSDVLLESTSHRQVTGRPCGHL